MQQTYAVVLAAGKSKRFQGTVSKLLTPLCNRPLVLYALDLLEKLNLPKSFVVGHEAEKVEALILMHAKKSTNFNIQAEQLGTGHAVACSKKNWQGSQILVLNADMPLVPPHLIEALINSHATTQATLSFVVFAAKNPGAYGRVIQTQNQTQIIEFKDCTAEQKKVNLVNAGIYLFDRVFLNKNIAALNADNAAKEFYLTDLIAIASEQNLKINTVKAREEDVLGVNTLEDFLEVQKILAQKSSGCFF